MTLLDSVTPGNIIPESDYPLQNILDQLKSATNELDMIVKEITSVTQNIDTYFPDTEDIIARL